MKRSLCFLVSFAAMVSFAAAQTVFINEIHYDNVSGDVNEGVEIAGPAGTDLTGWTVVPYNGNGGANYTPIGSPTGTIPNQQNGYGTVWVPIAGLQNGSPDGVALVDSGSNVIQFLSYEGSFSATAGPANGMTSVDIGVVEDGATPTTFSLQLVGTGSDYTDFTWTGPIGATNGAVNTGQTFQAPVVTDDPDASFVPTSLNFGLIVNDATKDLDVYVQNDGASTNNLDITAITFGGADPSFFSLVTSLPITGIAPGTSTTLTFRYDPALTNGADHNATATLTCNDPNPPTIDLAGQTYLDVADLAAARAAGSGAAIRILGVATVNSPTGGLNTGGNRHQLAVQDASGTDGQTGLFIDDPAYNLATDYIVGDQLQNLTGSLTVFSGLLELQPAAAASLAGTGAAITPLVLTGTELLDDVESELIRLNTVSITTTDINWAFGTSGRNYNLDAAVGPISQIRVEEGSQLVGDPIPTTGFDIIGLCGRFNATGQIFPRFGDPTSDVIPPATRVIDWPLVK